LWLRPQEKRRVGIFKEGALSNPAQAQVKYMKRKLKEQFNQEVESYRKALLYFAKKSDWETFEARAGKMFDYLESIEFQELERRFFNTFSLILAVLILAVIIFFNLDFEVHQEWMRMKSTFLFSAIAVCSFEVYFYVNYRYFINVKTTYYPQRRKRFILGIEEDFRKYAQQARVEPFN
jgi:hypothetical protein